MILRKTREKIAQPVKQTASLAWIAMVTAVLALLVAITGLARRAA